MWFFVGSLRSIRFYNFSDLDQSRSQGERWIMISMIVYLSLVPCCPTNPGLWTPSSVLLGLCVGMASVLMSTPAWQVVTQGLSAGWAWSTRTPRASRATRSPWDPRPEWSKWSTCESSLLKERYLPSIKGSSLALPVILEPPESSIYRLQTEYWGEIPTPPLSFHTGQTWWTRQTGKRPQSKLWSEHFHQVHTFSHEIFL